MVRTFRTILNEQRRPVNESPVIAPVVQRASNSAYRERLGFIPFQLTAGRKHGLCRFGSGRLHSGDCFARKVDGAVPRVGGGTGGAHAEALECAQQWRARGLTSGGSTKLPVFTVGDHVLVARIRKLRSAPKLVNTWMGPWCAVSGGSSYVYVVQNIVSTETKRMRVVRMRHTRMRLSRWDPKSRTCLL